MSNFMRVAQNNTGRFIFPVLLINWPIAGQKFVIMKNLEG